MKPSDLQERGPIVALFAGKSGSGKTAAIASLAELGPMYIQDIDQRARGMLGCTHLNPEVLSNIEIDQSITFSSGWQALDKKLEIFKIKQEQRQSSFKTLVVESAYTLQQMLIADSMRLRGMDKNSFKGKVRGGMRFFHPDDYNYASTGLKQIVYEYFLSLRCNVIVSGWVVDEWGKPQGEGNEYSDNVVVGKKLLGTDKFVSEFPGYFDEVYYFNKEETGASSNPLKFTVQFETSLAKTSRQELRGKGVVDLTHKSFYKVYQELLNGAKK